MSDSELEKYGLSQANTVALLNEVELLLARTGVPGDKCLSTFASMYAFDLRRDPKVAYSMESTIEILGIAVTPGQANEAQAGFDRLSRMNVHAMWRAPEKASEWGRQFVARFIGEIRKALCGENSEFAKQQKEHGATPKAAAVALATTVMSQTGIDSPTALGAATFLLLVLAHATKKSLCTMTDAEVLKAIDDKIAGQLDEPPTSRETI